MLRNLLIFSALAVAAACSASFDMLLLPSSDGRIYRYDPVNRVALGSYTSASTPMIAASYSTENSYSGTPGTSAVRSYNYSTGELNGIYTGLTNMKSIDISGTNLYQLSSTSVRRLNLSSGVGTTFTFSSAITGMTSCIYGNFLHVLGINASNQIQYQTLDLTTGTFGAVTNAGLSITAGSTFGKAAIAVNPANGRVGVLFTYVSGGSLFGAYSDVQSTGQNINTLFSALTFNSLGFSTATGMPAVVAGHSGYWVIGQDSTDITKTRIAREDLYLSPLVSENYVMTSPSAGYNPAIASYVPANVIAPEPAEFLALGVGLAGLILKKRRKKVS